MADDTQQREEDYSRQLQADIQAARQEKQQQEQEQARRPRPGEQNKNESLFTRMGKGKIARYGKLAIGAGLLASPGGPKGAGGFAEQSRHIEQQNNQLTEQRMTKEQQEQQNQFGSEFQLPGQNQNQLTNVSLSDPLAAKQNAPEQPQPDRNAVRDNQAGESIPQKQEAPQQNRIPKGDKNTLSNPLPQTTATDKDKKKDNGDATEEKGEDSKPKLSQQGEEAGAGADYLETARKLRLAKQLSQGGIKGVAKEAVNEISQLGTARALSWAWLTLIPSFGLTFLYLDFHFIARYIFHSEKFCAFGEEWMLRRVGGAGGSQAEIQEALKGVGNLLEIVEIMGMVLINVLIGTIIYLSIVIGYFILNPLEVFSLFLGGGSGGAGATGGF